VSNGVAHDGQNVTRLACFHPVEVVVAWPIDQLQSRRAGVCGDRGDKPRRAWRPTSFRVMLFNASTTSRPRMKTPKQTPNVFAAANARSHQEHQSTPQRERAGPPAAAGSSAAPAGGRDPRSGLPRGRPRGRTGRACSCRAAAAEGVGAQGTSQRGKHRRRRACKKTKAAKSRRSQL